MILSEIREARVKSPGMSSETSQRRAPQRPAPSVSPPSGSQALPTPVFAGLQLAEHARTRKASQTAIIEAALASSLSPDVADRLEASPSRQLDGMTRDIARLQWHAEPGTETLAIFIRF